MFARAKRDSTRFRRTRRISLCHVMVGLAALAACTPRTEMWSPAESPKRNKVTWTEFHHAVAFDTGSAELRADQRTVLDRFINRLGDGEGVRITVASADSGNSGLALRREATIVAHLRDHGLQPRLAVAPGTMMGQSVQVTIGRNVVTPPACGDWSKPANDDPANQVSSNFGCATATNLGLMVADPGSLVRGRATGPADGEAMAKSVQDYRENKTPWLPSTAAFKIQGSTGGDSKGGGGNQ
jgi:pilus assembly protein CpaD